MLSIAFIQLAFASELKGSLNRYLIDKKAIVNLKLSLNGYLEAITLLS
jgi:hypothetical protein